MAASSRKEIVEVFDAFRDVVSRLAELSFEGLTTPELLRLLQRLEQDARCLPVTRQALINRVRQQAGAAEIGGKLAHVLADRLRITRGEATRRIQEAEDLGQRQALTGEPLPARLAATAAAQRASTIGDAHVQVIRAFLRDLPCWIDADTRHCVEAKLADLATQFRPEQLAKLADKLADCLNPDGEFSDNDRARLRELTLGKQEADGMSFLRGYLTPAARAALEAVLAKLAAPGRANPYDPTPVLDGTPSQEAIDRDTRTPAPTTACTPRCDSGLRAARSAQRATGQHYRRPTCALLVPPHRRVQTTAPSGISRHAQKS